MSDDDEYTPRLILLKRNIIATYPELANLTYTANANTITSTAIALFEAHVIKFIAAKVPRGGSAGYYNAYNSYSKSHPLCRRSVPTKFTYKFDNFKQFVYFLEMPYKQDIKRHFLTPK